MKILVTGATGFIGRAVSHHLREKGHTVVTLTRGPMRPGHAGNRDPSIVAWNPTEGLTPDHGSPLAGLDAVVHLAGEPIAARRWTAAQKDRIRDSRVRDTRMLVDGLASLRLQPKVFIAASAIGIYGDRGDEQLDETSAPGRGFLADVCSAWEEETRRAEQHGARSVSLRIGLVLGRNGGALARMLLPFRLGLGGPFGTGRQWVSWVHLDDVVGLIELALQPASRLTGPMNVTAPNPVRNRDFARALGRVLRRPAIFPVPSPLLRIALGEMSDVLLHSQRVLPRVALQAGYRFTYPTVEEALTACVQKA